MAGTMVFGKLPAHGDFVSRGIAAAERDALDLWLAHSLADARETLGGVFEEVYDLAQPWRFAWREEACWTAGAIAPSVDGVGRRYPIMVAVRGLETDAVPAMAAAAEGLIYDALSGGWTADALADALAAVIPADGGEWTSVAGWWTVNEAGKVSVRIDGARPAHLVAAMLTMGAGQEGGA